MNHRCNKADCGYVQDFPATEENMAKHHLDYAKDNICPVCHEGILTEE